VADQQQAREPQVSVDENGRLHFDGSTEELHSYIDRLNQSVAWMNAKWEEYLNAQELSRVAEIREWWKEDSAGIAELTPEGWPPNGSFPELGTQAFEYMREISEFHRIAEGRMIEAAEIRERDEVKAGTNLPTSAE
jgi:hypothetical protein